ncbi:MAG: hypothetical protein GXC76_12390 [Rhodanobacteraceae bacterium]|jgi:hypothetical protein|nr:hypothetical protein [Rhodanobacteraceae bacterium]
MATSGWTPTSEALPAEGNEVEFVLDCRDLAMTGTYHCCHFVSRWSQYSAGTVREWRKVPAAEAPRGEFRGRA